MSLFAALIAVGVAYTAPGPRGLRASAVRSSPAMNMATAEEVASKFDLPIDAEDLAIVGLATAFVTDEGGKPKEVSIIEPLPSGTVETICKGIETSVRRAYCLPWKDLVLGDAAQPTGINMANLAPLLDGEKVLDVQADWMERAMAAARTIKRRRDECERLVPVGEVCGDYNFSTKRKRVLDQKYEPDDNDNIKQDISIDVYGRDSEQAKEVDRLANL